MIILFWLFIIISFSLGCYNPNFSIRPVDEMKELYEISGRPLYCCTLLYSMAMLSVVDGYVSNILKITSDWFA